MFKEPEERLRTGVMLIRGGVGGAFSGTHKFMCTFCVQMPEEVRASLIPWNWSYRQL
jgi:hypothetical protein